VELDGPIILAILYGVVALLKKVGERAKGGTMAGGGTADRQLPGARRGQRPRPKTMEELLREMAGEVEPADVEPMPRAPAPPRLPAPTPWEWEVEERESLEMDPTVVSTETAEAFDRPVPMRLDYDDDAEALVRRRVQAADARNAAWQPSDHRRFDAQIRKEVAAPVRDDTRALAIRRAMIWHEVLSKPVSLRDEE
jgi:hypothetical protein